MARARENLLGERPVITVEVVATAQRHGLNPGPRHFRTRRVLLIGSIQAQHRGVAHPRDLWRGRPAAVGAAWYPIGHVKLETRRVAEAKQVDRANLGPHV